MVLSNATLFPQAMLPLYIFEPRYRRMLAEALERDRMFAVAMRKPTLKNELPSNVGGLGLIRAAVDNKDGTSHVILQGVARVKLLKPTQTRPYRIHPITVLETTGSDSLAVDALTAKLLDLVAERFEKGFKLPIHIVQQLVKLNGSEEKSVPSNLSLKQVINYLNGLEDPDQLADLVSCTLLPAPLQRQAILETVNLEARLKCLIHFLMDDDDLSDLD